MSFLYNNLTAIFVALLASVSAWVFGGLRGDLMLGYAPWLGLLVLEGLVCFPQRHYGESVFAARQRVWNSLATDPLTWVCVAFLVMLAIPFVNTAPCPVCDAERIAAENLRPVARFSFLPYCVNRAHHLSVFVWFATALPSMLAVRHTLLKSGKRVLIELLVWNGFALAILGFVQQATGAKGPFWLEPTSPYAKEIFSTFGYSNVGGAYFTALFALAVAVWRRRVNEVAAESDPESKSPYRRFWRKNYALIPASLLYAASLATLSRAAIALATTLAVVFVILSAMTSIARMSSVGRVKAGFSWAFVIVIIAISAYVFTPDSVRREASTISATGALNRVSAKGEYHGRIAFELIKEHPAFGCGGWGYAHMSVANMSDEERKSLSMPWTTGGTNVHNDFLQFAVEHGLVGLGLLVIMALLLVVPVFRSWSTLAKAIRFSPDVHRIAKPIGFFALPASAFCILAGAAATAIHACADCPLRSHAVLMLLFVELAAIDGYLPRMRAEAPKAETKAETKAEEKKV